MTAVTGTDIVSVDRMGRLIDERGLSFLARWFTDAEIAYCRGKNLPSQHFAARLAAKESVVKALRCRWDGPVPYRSVEIVVDSDGVPSVLLHGRVREAAERAGVGAISVSLSHCHEYAIAIAIAIADAMPLPS